MKELFLKFVGDHPQILKELCTAIAIESECSEEIIYRAIHDCMIRFDISEAEAYYDLILYRAYRDRLESETLQ